MANLSRSISDPTGSKESIYVTRIEQALSGPLTWEKVDTASRLFEKGVGEGYFKHDMPLSVSYTSWSAGVENSTRAKVQRIIGEAITTLSQ